MEQDIVFGVVEQLLDERDFLLFKQNAVFEDYGHGSLFDPGPGCRSVYFVERGGMRIYRLNDEGKEITLYRIREGEMCLLSLNGGLSPLQFSSSAVIDGDTTLLTLPHGIYGDIFTRNSMFQQFILEKVMKALNSLMTLSEEIAFHSVDERVAAKILELKRLQGSSMLKTTHEEIANELGTAREVVSRVLKNLTDAGVIMKTRGRLRIVDETKLQKISVM